MELQEFVAVCDAAKGRIREMGVGLVEEPETTKALL